MAPHSSTLAWKIPWTEEPGRLQSMVSLRVGHDWVTSLSLFTFMHWRRKWQPTPVFLPGESQGQGAWWSAVCGVAQSRTWLKWLSSSSTLLVVYYSFLIHLEISSMSPSTLFFLRLFWLFWVPCLSVWVLGSAYQFLANKQPGSWYGLCWLCTLT